MTDIARVPRRYSTPTVFGALVALALAFLPVPSYADIVRFQNGRTMTVDTCAFDGDTVILDLPGGGEIRANRSIVLELLPDEVPYAHAVAIQALTDSTGASAARLTPGAIRSLVDRIAAKVGLDDKLAHAVVAVESNYDQRAVSPRGAMGLMQIMPAVAERYAVADPFDPAANLEAGMRYLRDLLQRFDVRRALAAYNAGEGAVAKYGGIPPYAETENYVRRVMTALR